MNALPSPNTAVLNQALIDELRSYPGVPLQWLPRWVLSLILNLPVRRFIRLAAQFDAIAGDSGFGAASQWALSKFYDRVETIGSEHIPRLGPLLIASNHPGTLDALVVAASLPRKDFKAIARGMPFLRSLPNVQRSLIFSMRNPHAKVAAARGAMRHLKSGGALLVYPTGTVDPDPASMPGLRQSLFSWSESLELLVRYAPETQVQIAFLSGFLAPQWLQHPIARLRADPRQRQITAEILQVLGQMLTRQNSGLTPRLVFDRPVSLDELQAGSSDGISENIRRRARRFLDDQIASGEFQP
jgi:hypothetical protein